MTKTMSNTYEANSIDPRILEAAQKLADSVVQKEIEKAAAIMCGPIGILWGERPSVVAAAIGETLYRLVLREDTTRWLAVVAEQEADFGIVATRTAIGRLAGYSRPGIEQRLALVGKVRAGRHNWTPRELRNAVIVDRAFRNR